MKNPGTEFVPKSAEEERKEKRKRKWELIAGAVGDGMSAVGNLIFASMGAPSGVITTTGKGKSTNKSLIEAIKGKHAAQDAEYGKKLSAWEKEEEKKRKEAEKAAKENERVNIHADFNPLVSTWNDEDFISLMYNDLIEEIGDRNKKKGKTTSRLQDHLTGQIERTSKNTLPYLKQSILFDVLDGTFKNSEDAYKGELDDEFLDMFRKKWKKNEEIWSKK